MRQVLPLWPTTPETEKHGAAPHLLKSRRDKTPLSEGLHRYSKGVLTHRPLSGLRGLWHGVGAGCQAQMSRLRTFSGAEGGVIG